MPIGIIVRNGLDFHERINNYRLGDFRSASLPLGVLDDLELGIDREFLELGHEKLVITALFGHQLVVAAGFQNALVADIEDAVAALGLIRLP